MELFECIHRGDGVRFKQLLKENPRCILECWQGLWPAFEVALSGNQEMLQHLVEYSLFSLNHTDKNHNNILHFAVQSGNLDCVAYLVERCGMSPGSGNWEGITPYDVAGENQDPAITAYFEEQMGAPLEAMYRNPVARGMHPDPSVIRFHDEFYMVNSSFIYFPCIPISRSRDLLHWEVVGHAIADPEYATELEQLEGGRGYWAPDISVFEGRFYITATLRLNDGMDPCRLQMATSADRPEGPYGKPVFLNEDGIDPSLFTDVDNRRYMLLNRGARIFEISKDGSEILSRPRLLWYGSQKRAPEGPHLLFYNGYYYLFVAEGGTGMGHRISVARAKTLAGPYEDCPYNPIMRQWDEGAPIQCCGHGKPVQLQDGRFYMIYLCSRRINGRYGLLGRETCLDPITWTADGWPLVNHLRGPSMLQKKPFPGNLEVDGNENDMSTGPLAVAGRESGMSSEPLAVAGRENDMFPDAGRWGNWVVPRVLAPGSFRYCDGGLYLRGNGHDLNSVKCRSVLLQRQIDFRCQIGCTAHFATLADGEDAGLTCYYDENSYFKFGAVREGGKASIFVKEYIGDGYQSEYCCEEITTHRIELRIHAAMLRYQCEWRIGQESEWIPCRALDHLTYLSSEGLDMGKRFTGAMSGIYVNGGSEVRFERFWQVREHTGAIP